MSLIKCYHTCDRDEFKPIFQSGAIKPQSVLTPDECVHLSGYFTYFRPFQPHLHAGFGNQGFVFDAEVLIRDFDPYLGLDMYGLVQSTKEEILRDYEELQYRYEPWGVSWPRLGALCGDDALAVLRQLQLGLASSTNASQDEWYLIESVELRCTVEVPLSRAYSYYSGIPKRTWWKDNHWNDDIDDSDQVIHQYWWEKLGYEIRLNK